MKYPFLNLGTVNEPYFDELCQAAERVIRSGRYIGGQEVELLEQEVALLLKAPYAVAVSNGLDALRLILTAYVEMGIFSSGDEVLVPANTYIATFLAVSHSGLKPIPVDVDITTMNLDTAAVARSITSRTVAIMPVHLYGRVCWDEKLVEAAQNHGLKIIEDAAQSIGAQSPLAGLFGSRMAGALGHASGISFYPTKNIGALGDAGIVATHDAELASIVRALANYGCDTRYHNKYQGFNCRLDPLQAAMLRVKLSHINEENGDRWARAMAYEREINNPCVIKPLITPHVTDCVFHQYVIRVSGDHRDEMKQQLTRQGVETDIHYPVPAHLQPCYPRLSSGSLPVTEQLAREILSLPIARGTSVKDASEIAHIINQIKF